MKLKFLLTITALVLALCFTLAACGEQQSGGATADSATADFAETINTAPATTTVSPSASSEEETTASAASSEAEASPAPAPAANIGNNEDILYEDDTPEQEEEHEEQLSSSSAVSSNASSTASSKASSGNPAYKEDEKPVYTISMTNKKTKKTYSAACSYKTDKEEIASAAFFLPGGEYDIAVYEYSESKDKGDPLAEATYKNSIGEDKRKSVHVNYTPKDNKIEVVASTSSRNQ